MLYFTFPKHVYTLYFFCLKPILFFIEVNKKRENKVDDRDERKKFKTNIVYEQIGKTIFLLSLLLFYTVCPAEKQETGCS